jgi:hypothetical protein
MPVHDFSPLYAHYPTIIARMPETFTSHEFILELARHNQAEYIEALYSYRHHNNDASFQIVTLNLARKLSAYPELVAQISKKAPSKDIFGQSQQCSEWRKL